jgi:phosphate starvation-inducible PhoH-like protein
MGALPGDINEKIWPFLRPVIDEMEDALGNKSIFKSMLSDGVIEFCPFSVMRGRNFKRSFVILDEAQNCGYSQLKMFLTRFGEGSKMVLNGDLSQSDLPKKFQGGLLKVWKSLQGVEDIGSVELTHDDILREPLVERILKRLEDD